MGEDGMMEGEGEWEDDDDDDEDAMDAAEEDLDADIIEGGGLFDGVDDDDDDQPPPLSLAAANLMDGEDAAAAANNDDVGMGVDLDADVPEAEDDGASEMDEDEESMMD